MLSHQDVELNSDIKKKKEKSRAYMKMAHMGKRNGCKNNVNNLV